MFERISKEVKILIEKYGLLHPSALAERCGIFVLRVPYRRVHGVSLTLGGLRVVAVDPSLPAQRQNGALLHETGHQVLHPGTVGFFIEANPFERPTKYELEAHLFALLYALRWDRWGFEVRLRCISLCGGVRSAAEGGGGCGLEFGKTA